MLNLNLPPPPQRKCGPCSACCHVFSLKGATKTDGTPVPEKECFQRCSLHKRKKGCTIWKHKPSQCSEFHCLWITAADGRRKERPDQCGMMMAILEKQENGDYQPVSLPPPEEMSRVLSGESSMWNEAIEEEHAHPYVMALYELRPNALRDNFGKETEMIMGFISLAVDLGIPMYTKFFNGHGSWTVPTLKSDSPPLEKFDSLPPMVTPTHAVKEGSSAPPIKLWDNPKGF